MWSFNSRHTIASKPMKNLTPPGLIATGIPWLEYGPGQATLQSPFNSPRRSPSPLPTPLRLEQGRALGRSPSASPMRALSPVSPVRPLRPLSPSHDRAWQASAPSPVGPVQSPVVMRAVSQATSVPAPIPLAPSSEATQTARSSISRMTTNPCVGRVVYLPPITVPASGQTETPSQSRSISPLRSPSPHMVRPPRIISDVVIPGATHPNAAVEEPLSWLSFGLPTSRRRCNSST